MTISIHPINYVDDVVDATIRIPGAIRDYMRTDHEIIGQRIKATVRITAAGVVLAVLIALDVAKLMYQAGFALGQSVHKLNHDLTLFLCGWGFGLPPIQPLAPQVNPWQLQLPILSNVVQSYVSGSISTTGTAPDMVKNPSSSMSMTPPCDMVDQKKEVGGLKSESLSKASASSARSKPSEQHSSLTSGRSRSTARRTTSTASQRTESSTKTSTARRTRKSVRTTSDIQA